MFQKLHHKLVAICCLCTTCIVLVIILACLALSEENMRNEEESLFLLKANNVAYDLMTSNEMNMTWYQRNSRDSGDILYIEVDGVSSAISQLLLSDAEKELIGHLQEKLPDPYETGSGAIRQHFYEYSDSATSYMVMSSTVTKGDTPIHSLYIHPMGDFQQRIREQRLHYLLILLLSAASLAVFSFFFTGHAMKPVIANQEKQKQFVALASHELRSPLAVFKTGLSILKSNPAPEAADRFYTILEGEVKRMERLVSDLLFLSKAEQSSLGYQFAPVNLAVLLDSVYQKYLPLAQERQITLELHTAEPLWSSCDSQRMEQVIVIFLDNAFTYTPPGGSITLGLESKRGRCQLYVRDTGPGISAEEKRKIFEKFYQANASHNNKEHFGLGLAIAKEICRAHKANITVTDTPGGGATFSVTLPAVRRP